MMRSVLMMDEEGVGVLLDEQEEEDEEVELLTNTLSFNFFYLNKSRIY